MGRPEGREPTVEIRRRKRKHGMSEEPGVRYFDSDGVRRRKAFATVAEAEIARAQMALAGAPAAAVPSSTTLAAFWPVWLADASERLQENTLNDYCYFWQREVEPQFGDAALRDVTPRAVAQWRSRLAADGVGRESIRKSMVLLQAIFSVAVEWGEASDNPVSAVRKPRQGRSGAITVIEPLKVERLRADMLAADDLLTATLTVVLAYSGMRPAEALALERRHVRADTILVEQAVACGKVKRQKTGRVYRTVDLLGPLGHDLAAWFDASGIRDPGDRLFPLSGGGWWTKDDWDRWRDHRFRRFTKAAGFGLPRPYDLRHSFASLLIREQRASIVDIADQLGHAPTETLSTYGHVMREYRRQKPVDAVEAISAARLEIAENAIRDAAAGVASDALERTNVQGPTRTGEA